MVDEVVSAYSRPFHVFRAYSRKWTSVQCIPLACDEHAQSVSIHAVHVCGGNCRSSVRSTVAVPIVPILDADVFNRPPKQV